MLVPVASHRHRAQRQHTANRGASGPPLLSSRLAGGQILLAAELVDRPIDRRGRAGAVAIGVLLALGGDLLDRLMIAVIELAVALEP
jgi:hypothetical protein